MIRSERRLALGIFVTTLFVYLLTSGREPPWGDGHVQYMVTKSLVDHGGIDVPKAWPDDLPRAPDGKYYSTYPILTSAVQLPGLALLQAVPKSARRFAEPLTTHIACSLFGALCCVLFFRLCRQRGFDVGASSAATAVLAFATTVWVYAHYSYSEIAQAAFFTGLLLETLRLAEEPTPARARWFGLWAGLLFSVKYIYAAALIGAAVYLVIRLRPRWAVIGRAAGWAAVTAVPFLIVAMVYNAMSWGSPFGTGYAPYFEAYWGENLLVGLWGVFLSPGKSLFLYSPPLILGLVALPILLREHRAACLAFLVTAGPVLLLYARYKLNGDYAWGPRFAVFATPALGLSFAALFDAWRRRPGWIRRAVVAGTVALGVAVQVLGLAFYWDHFIRISMDARTDWLGKPDRKGAIIPVRADGRCDSCFEDVHQLQWLPPFQPILGHLWLARSQLADRDWKEAAADAPWTRHTSLELSIRPSYERVRLDWWGMLWLRDFRRYRAAGIALLVLFAASAVAGALLWRRALRELPAQREAGEPGPVAGS